MKGTNLASNGEFVKILVSDWSLLFVWVIKYDCDAGFSDPGLTVLVHKLL